MRRKFQQVVFNLKKEHRGKQSFQFSAEISNHMRASGKSIAKTAIAWLRI